MANPFEVRVPNALEALMAGRAGYDTGRQYGQDQAMRGAGGDLSSGNYESAIARLMQGGNLQGALAVAGLNNNNRDFQFRQQESQRAQRNTDRGYGLQERQVNATLEGNKVPQGFQPDPTKPGALRPVPGGPQDPAYIADTRKGPNLSVSDITKLSEEGGKFANLNGFMQTFKPEYGGMTASAWGNLVNAAARNAPEFLSSPTERDRASWWQNYDRYKNVVRNDLFGSALTATEQAAFEKADIHPGMNPQLIQQNLAEQKKVIEAGIKRKASALVSGGHDGGTIAKAYGIPPEQLGVPAKRGAASGPVRISSPQERDALAPNTQYIAPDGSIRTKQ